MYFKNKPFHFQTRWFKFNHCISGHIDGLVQDCSISIVNAPGVLHSYVDAYLLKTNLFIIEQSHIATFARFMIIIYAGPLFTKKTSCYWYRNSHYKPETSSYRFRFIMGTRISVRRRLFVITGPDLWHGTIGEWKGIDLWSHLYNGNGLS